MKKLTQDEVYLIANQLLLPQTLSEICNTIKVDVYDVMALSINKKYHNYPKVLIC